MASRDGAAFAEFVLAWSPALHRAAYLMGGTSASPDDLGLTLYRCTMPDASCELASEIGAGDSSEPSAEPVLPDGRWYGPEEAEGGDG